MLSTSTCLFWAPGLGFKLDVKRSSRIVGCWLSFLTADKFDDDVIPLAGTFPVDCPPELPNKLVLACSRFEPVGCTLLTVVSSSECSRPADAAACYAFRYCVEMFTGLPSSALCSPSFFSSSSGLATAGLSSRPCTL